MDSSQIEQVLSSLDARLSRIEAVLKIAPSSPAPEPPSASSPPPTTASTSPVHARRGDLRTGNWLGIIAVICFVLAAAFIVKLSIDTGWLTPRRQAGLATLLGLGLVVAGLILRQTDRAYAALLPAAGVVIFYLTAFAAHRYYHMISFDSAIAVTSFVSALCVWLYSILKHDMYAFTAAVGAYLAPVLLDFHAGAQFTLYYFLVCSLAFSAISVWLQSRTLAVLASYLAITLSGAIGIGLGADSLVAIVMAAHFAIFAAGSWAYTKQHGKPLTAREAWGFLPVLLIFYALEYHFINRIQPGAAPWIALAFAAMLIALYLGVKANFKESRDSQWLILALVTIILFQAGYLELMPEGLKPYLFSVVLIGAAGTSTKQYGFDRHVFLFPILGVGVIAAIEYLGMLGRMWTESGPPELAALVAVVALWALIVLRTSKQYREVMLGGAHLMTLLACYRLTADINSLAVSASWLLYGAGVMIFAFVRKDAFMAKSSLFVLALAAGKALLVDASSAATIVRILCLLLTGAVLYGCGFLMRQFQGWAEQPPIGRG